MKNLLFVLLPLLLIASCKKEEVIEPEVKYDIYVNDWNPDLVGNSQPFFFDINGNGQIDFSYQIFGRNDHYDSAGYDVYLRARYEVMELMIDTTFRIATYSDTLNSNLFAIDEAINPSAIWEGGVTLYGKRWWDHSNSNSNVEYYYNPFEINNGDAYLALKREINGDSYYGWIHLNVQPDKVTFYQSGFNNIPNVPIRIGQTE